MLKLNKCYKTFAVLICFFYTTQVQAFDLSILAPIQLNDVKDISLNASYTEEEDSSSLEMRLDAMREAALSYGALSGMFYRNFEIYHILERDEVALDTVFNFSRLMIPTHYGALIEPPIISESENSFLLEEGGMSASMTSKIYSIGKNVKIVTAPKNWRDYLMDYIDLSKVEKPETVLRPRSNREKDAWDNFIETGWDSGIDQANEIFEDNLNLLVSDYIGMIRYKKLVAQNMISEPFAVKEDRGITGNSDEIRIDDKAVIITSIPALNKSSNKWNPTER